MTTWTDSDLMAFVDGELEAAQSQHLEADLSIDPALQGRVSVLLQQRARLAAAFDSVLDEPIPDRLSQLLRVPASTANASQTLNVVDLGTARTQKEQRQAEQAAQAAAQRKRSLPSWAQWGGMAASVVLGVLMGTQLQPVTPEADIGLQGGKLVAGGAIEKSLSTQLASAPLGRQNDGMAVAVQLSFVDQGGQYCRTFSTDQLAGLACQDKGQWAVQQLATTNATLRSDMRQASSALPQAILDAVDQRMAGEALDAEAEQAARAKGWKR